LSSGIHSNQVQPIRQVLLPSKGDNQCSSMYAHR
jgi:hypothetical protein